MAEKEKQITVKGDVFIPFHNLEMAGMKDRRSPCTLPCLIQCFLYGYTVNINTTIVAATRSTLREQPNERTCTRVICSSIRAKLGSQKLFRYRDNNTTHGRV